MNPRRLPIAPGIALSVSACGKREPTRFPRIEDRDVKNVKKDEDKRSGEVNRDRVPASREIRAGS